MEPEAASEVPPRPPSSSSSLFGPGVAGKSLLTSANYCTINVEALMVLEQSCPSLVKPNRQRRATDHYSAHARAASERYEDTLQGHAVAQRSELGLGEDERERREAARGAARDGMARQCAAQSELDGRRRAKQVQVGTLRRQSNEASGMGDGVEGAALAVEAAYHNKLLSRMPTTAAREGELALEEPPPAPPPAPTAGDT